ncbi:MAG: hypothetical protein NTZ10_00095 [Candidatus Saganbacteria bacterium]|nr:hypothetical protein [Candidatus Saganbacteria bacterium]
MTIRHKDLASGRWHSLRLCEQMGNIGSEVERTINRKNKGDAKNRDMAFERAIELFDLTITDPKNLKRLRELTRTREAFVDFIWFDNQYGSTDELWKKYFLAFGFYSRLNVN